MASKVLRFPTLDVILSAGLICLLLMLPLSDGGRTVFARAMLAAGVFSLISLVLISQESGAFMRGLPLLWLAVVGLLTVLSFSVSIFKDFSVKEALTLLSVIGASVLAAHVARQSGSRWLQIALVASGVVATLVAAPAYLTGPSGAQAASALSGSFHYPNGLGSFLLLTAFLPFAFVFHSETRRASLASVSVLSVLFAGLILTHSRGVWAAALSALIFLMAVEWRLAWAHRRRLALAALLILGLVLIASRRPADIAPRFVSLTKVTSRGSHDTSIQWRREIYAWTLDIIGDHPWAGTGIGTFPIAIKLYQRAPYISGLYVHNHYLQTAAEMGLPALACLLLFLAVLFLRAKRLIRSSEPQSRERSSAVALAAGLLGSSLHAAVDLGWSYPAVALVFGAEAAILFCLRRDSPVLQEGPLPGPITLRAARPILLSFCLAMAILAGTRYYAELFRNEGKLALEVGERGRAIAAFRWALRLNPFSYSARHSLATAYAAQGDLNDSQREAEAAFRLDPFDGDAFYALARIHRLAGQHEKAESEFLSAVRLQPFTRPIFYYDLGEFLLSRGRPAEAQAWLRRGAEIFRPEVVTDRSNRCLAPGDRYILARMYWRIAEISHGSGRISDSKREKETAVQLARPAMGEICSRWIEERLLSPESTIVAYWDSRSRKDWPGVVATLASDAGQRFKDESLMDLPADIKTVEVDWIVSLVGNEDAAKVAYEIKLSSPTGQVKRVALTDALVVDRGGWRLRERRSGLN